MKKQKQIYELTLLSILTAILWVMDLSGIGYIPVGTGLTATLLIIPVVVGAICLGYKGGIFLGLMFGLTSFLQCVTGKDPVGVILLANYPVLTFIACIVPRVLMGFCVALLYKWLFKLLKGNVLSNIIASISGTLFNTLFFLITFWLCFSNTENLFKFIWAALAINFVVEIIVNSIVGAVISKALYVYSNKKKYN